MTPGLRKFALTTHVTSSVGWLGAVAGFEALAVAGLTSRDVLMARAAYLAMERTAWFVIVPLAVASFVTGLVMSLGTKWGLFRHYWIVAKFLINALAIVLLLVHTRLIRLVASAAAEGTLFGADLHLPRIQLVAVPGVALLALLAATTLAVYKPRGMTPYGRRQPQHRRETSRKAATPRTAANGSRYLLAVEIAAAVVGLIILVAASLHLAGSHHPGGGSHAGGDHANQR